MRPRSPVSFATLIGFLAVTGSFGAGLSVALGQDDAPRAQQPAPPRDDPSMMQAYVPLPEQIRLGMADGRTARATIILSVKGSPADLLDLHVLAKERQPDMMAALLQAAQTEAQAATDPAMLRVALRLRLAEVVNERLGTETLPAPVQEVLLSEFLLH